MKIGPQLSRFRPAVLLLGLAAVLSCSKNAPAPPPPPAVAAAVPAPSNPAPTITLRANPATVERGRNVTLQWEAANATTVRIEPNIGEVGLRGNRDVSPTSSVTYLATATGPGGTATDTARITVGNPPPPAETAAPGRNTPAPNATDLFQNNVQPVFFDYDKSDIRSDQVARIQASAAWLKQNSAVRFTIEGHCDERGSQEYNLALGDRRANAVKEALIQQGIPESRMTIISYGEEKPECREATEDCMQRNRRAAFVLP